MIASPESPSAPSLTEPGSADSSLLTPWAVRTRPVDRARAAADGARVRGAVGVDQHQVARAVAGGLGDREGDPGAVGRVGGATDDEAARLDLVGPEDVGRAAAERARGEPREAEAAARGERRVDVGDGRAVGRERRELLAAAAGSELADRVVVEVLDVDAAVVGGVERAEGEQPAVGRVDGVSRRLVGRREVDLGRRATGGGNGEEALGSLEGDRPAVGRPARARDGVQRRARLGDGLRGVGLPGGVDDADPARLEQRARERELAAVRRVGGVAQAAARPSRRCGRTRSCRACRRLRRS